MLMLAYSGFTMAQVIENFESLKMNLFNAGTNGSLTVVPNPDKTGINTSVNVVKMVRGVGTSDAGWYGTLPTAINLTANKFVHLKVWKPRLSDVHFKLERSDLPDGKVELSPMNAQTVENGWEELVFDFTAVEGDITKIVFYPDFESPLTITEDITLYFDDLTINNDPAVGSAAVQIMEDYETIELGPFSDQGTFTLIDNPDKSGINLSDHVIDFLRLKDAVAWTGFYSHLVDKGFSPVDATNNHYVHVKFWKPRLSDAKFKLEGGPQPDKEFPSTNTSTEINKWQDIVFDISEYSGDYPTIGLLADMSGTPLEGDIHIYIDDIIVNNDPNPMSPAVQKLSIDMNGVAGFDPVANHVFISGALGGDYGTWAEPGTIPGNEMFDPDGDGIYSLDMYLPDGVIAFKFFFNTGTGWGTGDPVAGGDRTYTINGNANLIFTWNVAGFVTSIRDNKLAGKIQMYPNPVRNELTINSTSDIRKVIITNTLGKVVGNVAYNSNKTINTSNLSKGLYFVTFIGADGNKVTQKLIKD